VITPANDLPPITSDAKMTAAVPNFDGVRVWAGNFNVIGGAEDSARNVISGNIDDGVEIETGQAKRVEGNRIGTSGDGVASLPNGYGVFVETSFSVIVDNLVSGNTNAGVTLDGVGFGPPPIGNLVDGNEVAGNGMGVVVEDSHNNAITANVISANLDDGVLIEAVDLAADGATNNDGLLDPDAGPNGLQNHPTISGRSLVFERLDELPFLKSYTLVSWTLRSAASSDYRVELYGADACDASGRGEALELVATQQVTTDATGLATGSVRFETASVSPSIAATATVPIPTVSCWAPARSSRPADELTLPGAAVVSLGAMATPSTSQPTPQRLAAIREQLSLLADYL
jgi:parallel beta-helix repeat protein